MWGRPLFLYDCDAFTRAWYVRHGVPEEQLRAAKVDVEAKLQARLAEWGDVAIYG